LLYRLSSDPASASDALKLLHELQTHQVELDLQHAQLLESENELHAQLAHYRALYEQAPIGYLVLEGDGRILQSNRAAAELLGLDAARAGESFARQLAQPGQQGQPGKGPSSKPVSIGSKQVVDGRRLTCADSGWWPAHPLLMMPCC
jgi:PAS domain-containing protein